VISSPDSATYRFTNILPNFLSCWILFAACINININININIQGQGNRARRQPTCGNSRCQRKGMACLSWMPSPMVRGAGYPSSRWDAAPCDAPHCPGSKIACIPNHRRKRFLLSHFIHEKGGNFTHTTMHGLTSPVRDDQLGELLLERVLRAENSLMIRFSRQHYLTPRCVVED
jgi:hypothetical protein